jgi:Cu2+-exporting ATPase
VGAGHGDGDEDGRALGRRPGVLRVEANPVGQTAVVVYDPARTSVAELAGWVRDCGYHCAGQSVPEHICDPAAEPAARTPGTGANRSRPPTPGTRPGTTPGTRPGTAG